jgi:hypothetical protein
LSLLIATLLFSTTQAAQADISGYVFRDYNANGQRDDSATFKEPYVGGGNGDGLSDIGCGTNHGNGTGYGGL